MVMAYVDGENVDEAIPFDVIEIKNANEKKALVLEKGKYKLVMKSNNGEIEKRSIEVK